MHHHSRLKVLLEQFHFTSQCADLILANHPQLQEPRTSGPPQHDSVHSLCLQFALHLGENGK